MMMMMTSASPWAAGDEANRQMLDQIERYVIHEILPVVEGYPEPRPQSVEILHERVIALADEVKAARKNEQTFLFHRARVSSVLADITVIMQTRIKSEAEALTGKRFPTNAALFKFAREVKQAAHSQTLPFKLPVDERGFLLPLTNAVSRAEAKRQRKAEKRAKK